MIYPWPERRFGNTDWRFEPTGVEKPGDELWVGVKGQSNPEIARTPRNSFRTSLEQKCNGGRALIGLGPVKGTDPCQTPNAVYMFLGSQAVRDKLHSREGNNPDRQLRSPSAD